MDIVEKFKAGAPVTCHAAVALTGGRMCNVTAEPTGGNPTVGLPAAGATTFGVASQDTAIGGKVRVARPGTIVAIEAAAVLAAGNLIESNAAGQAIVRAAGIVQGRVITGAGIGGFALIDYRPALL